MTQESGETLTATDAEPVSQGSDIWRADAEFYPILRPVLQFGRD